MESDTARVLFVDDDRQILDMIHQFLTRVGFSVTTAENGQSALSSLQQADFDVVFTDLRMPDIDGMELLKTIKEQRPDTEVIVITGFGTIESAIEALKHGSYDYLQKPIDFQRLKLLIERIREKKKLENENRLIKQRLKEIYANDQLIGNSLPMQKVYAVINRIGHRSPTVLIQGETGTGKELLANVIHQNSDRVKKPFIPLNCGAIVEGLLESELFGHVKGAFTGAIRDKVGLFKAADGGTLFLDEITELNPALQVKLLRVLQGKRVMPVGDTREYEVDVRVIAATNMDVEKALQNRKLRKDLYYRLNVVSITLPPLRERADDIPLLVRHFIGKQKPPGREAPMKVSPEAMSVLMAYPWPGNIRQLENVFERAYALGVRDTLQVDDLPIEIRGAGADYRVPVSSLNLVENEKLLVRKALEISGGNRAEAAKLLGVDASTVYRKIEKYRLTELAG